MTVKDINNEIPKDRHYILCRIKSCNFVMYTCAYFNKNIIYPDNRSYGLFCKDCDFVGFFGSKLTHWTYFNEPFI